MNCTNNSLLPRLAATLLLAGVVILLSITTFAQSKISPVAGTTPEKLENRIRETESTIDLDETVKGTLLEYYRKASSLITQRQSYETAANEFARARESAPEQALVLRKALEKLESEASPQLLPEALVLRPLPELEQQLLSEKASLAALSTRLNELEAVLESQ